MEKTVQEIQFWDNLLTELVRRGTPVNEACIAADAAIVKRRGIETAKPLVSGRLGKSRGKNGKAGTK
jgi:hypothetical protein